jgi:membrane protein YdbS with pleckstrin-like domain
MSLKAFHLIFVTLLTALSFGCAAWAFSAGQIFWGVAAVAVGIFVIVYGVYFLKKLKRISYL